MAIWHVSKPTLIDSGIWGRNSWIEDLKFLILEGVEDFVEGSNAFWLLTLHSFVCPAYESLESLFRSRLPFQVFTLESRFSFSFLLIVPSCTQKFKIHPEWVNVSSRWFWLKNRNKNLVNYEKFSQENLFSLSIHIRSKWTFQVRNVGQDSWFWKKG